MQSVSDVAEALRSASANGQTVSIDRPGGDVVLALAGLDRVLEHEAGDLTCTVEAGIRLSALQAGLAEHGQMLALDPPGDPTIGACIAGDLYGPRSHRYGRMRDLVLGVTVVLGDGLVASSGGKVVKNVAGYDLGKLFCGSRGALGVIVRASLRLHPVPAAAATLVAPVSSVEDGEVKRQAILRSTLVPSALEVSSEQLVLLFEGSTRAVEAQIEAATAIVGGAEMDGAVWDEVRAQPGDRRHAKPSPLVERIRAELDPRGVLVAA